MTSHPKEELPQSSLKTGPRHIQPFRLRLTNAIEDFFMDVNWVHVAFKISAYTYIALLAWVVWYILPLPGHWSAHPEVLQPANEPSKYFDAFHGNSDCNIKRNDLYLDLHRTPSSDRSESSFCSNRAKLLESMSHGGRIGYDAAYIPRGCHYAWYDIDRICMIMERFDSIILIGDESLQSIYNGLNILLRQDLLHGAMQTWKMNADEVADCGCDNQFMRPSCAEKAIISSEQMDTENDKNNQHHKTPSQSYVCSRTPHAYLKIDSSTSEIPTHIIQQFNTLAPKRPPSYYKHIPIIISISPTLSPNTTPKTAEATFKSIIELATSTGRKTDILLLGPTAPGHTTLKHHKTNQDIWTFHHALAKFTHHNNNNIDMLGMWNLTIQASSFDGVRFSESVAITQAMMLLNWLSRLETS